MDAVLEGAVDLARDAAVEAADGADLVGDHLSATSVSDRLVTHLFACTLPGYRGWVWSVTLSRAPRGKEAAICEAHLVAADDALLSPPWVPWAERVQPGDIKPGMAVPRFDPDPRLEPGYTVTDAEDEEAVAIWELGLGRERVLGPLGRDEAAERWTARAQEIGSTSADGSSTTGAVGEFVIPLAGSMRLHFGVCANKWCPFDGTVVPVDHECHGQPQSAPERSAALWPANNPVFDTDASVALDLSTPEPAESTTADATAETATAASAAAEAPEVTPEAEATPEAAAEPDAAAPAEAPDVPEAPEAPESATASAESEPEATADPEPATASAEPELPAQEERERAEPDAEPTPDATAETEPATASAPEPGDVPGDAEGDR
ncbi:DUF3027 domain-containing protein [uncultured Demequina sp.]|uniref:DUF3027 domain-containing protein n=1 Tax=uncultured Demequina sp. TaxID=693499 RepID=UPI0025EAA388|nr:DUF3027 domain-containing protein [uncultured Demequina sp.]